MGKQEVYKTNVTCSIGFSIADPNNNWEKSNVSISSDIGPGYPEAEMMQSVLKCQMEDATKACEEQIEAIANKIIEKFSGGQ